MNQLQYKDGSDKLAIADNTEQDHGDGDDGDDSDNDKLQSELEELGPLECRAYYYTQKQYADEVQAYRAMQVLQGHCIPKFISPATFDSARCGSRTDFKDTSNEEDEDGYLWHLKRGLNEEEIGCIMGGIVW